MFHKAALTLRDPAYRESVLLYTEKQFAVDSFSGDVTTTKLFSKKQFGKAVITCGSLGVLAGRQEIEFFLKGKLKCVFRKKDGEKISANETVAVLSGDIRKILQLERTVLNLLGRMSGVASYADTFVRKAKKANSSAILASTRKTLYGLLDKRAAMLGGFAAHRLALGDAVLVKDNHLDLIERDIQAAISAFQKISRKISFFEIEVESEKEALTAALTIQNLKKRKQWRIPAFIMLDNFTVPQVLKTLRALEHKNLRSIAQVEVSGGINGKNILSYANSGADVISLGCVTKNAPSLDFSLSFMR